MSCNEPKASIQLVSAVIKFGQKERKDMITVKFTNEQTQTCILDSQSDFWKNPRLFFEQELNAQRPDRVSQP